MRLVDRILADGPSTPAFQEGQGQTVLEFLPHATVLVADNVSEYFFADSDKEVWHILDFPNIAPPFPICFIEMARPSIINSVTYGRTEWPEARPTQWGVLFIATHVPKDAATNPEHHIKLAQLQSYADRVNNGNSTSGTAAMIRGLNDVANAGGGWLVGATLVWYHPKSGLEPAWSWAYGVDMHGQAVNDSSNMFGPKTWGHISMAHNTMLDMVKYLQVHRNIHIQIQNDAPALCTPTSIANELLNLLKPALLAITFLHCRNTSTVITNPPPALSKKRVKRGHPPLCRYRTLQIHAVGKQRTPNTGLPGSPTGIEQSFHIMRGHFKHFTTKKLFGKHTGTYWWPMRTRGNRAVGTVVKDYTITP